MGLGPSSLNTPTNRLGKQLVRVPQAPIRFSICVPRALQGDCGAERWTFVGVVSLRGAQPRAGRPGEERVSVAVE
jgi:hypothetical protein